jgi:NADP-dependent 3-hydroxy acid dehydrogenase YdfG
MPSLAESSAVVTGATSGIGEAVAHALCEQGARVALVSRSRERLEHTALKYGGTAFAADLTSASDVHRLAEQLTDHFDGAPEIVVNAAGVFELAPVAETSIETFDATLAANLRAPFLLMHAFLPRMLVRGSGHIVSIGSIAGRQAFAGNGAYSASKFGLRGLHEVLTVELKGSGVRATLVEPTATDTPVWQTIDRARHSGLPAREDMLTPDAVAECVLFVLTAPPERNINYLGIERS